jgi:hypothetical protein
MLARERMGPVTRRMIFRPGWTTLVLAAFLAALAGLSFWVMTHRARVAAPEPASARAMRQIRAQLGPGAELRYAEDGQRRAVCGYVGRTRGGEAVGFVSTPNRILFSDDPLPVEFRQMRMRYCPGFLTAPPAR